MSKPTLYRTDFSMDCEGGMDELQVEALVISGVLVPVEPDEIIDIAADTRGHYPQGSGYFGLLLPAGKYAVVRIGGDDE